MILLAATFFLQVGIPAPQPPVRSEVTVHNEVTVSAPPPDPQVVAETSNQSAQAIFVSTIAPIPVKFANDMLDLPDVITQTPPKLTYEAGPLNDLNRLMLDNSIPLIGLAILALAVARQVGEYTGLGGRIMFAVAMAIGTLLWWRLGIELNNILCRVISPPNLLTWGRPHLAEFDPLTNPVEQVTSAALTVVHAVVLLLLLGGMWFRIVFIDIFMVVGALALIMHATPESEHWADRYSNMSVGLVFSQVLVVIGLKVAEVIREGGGTQATLLTIIALLAVRKMPGLMSQMGAGGRNIVQRTTERFIGRRLGLR